MVSSTVCTGLLVYEHPQDALKAKELVAFLTWAETEGQKMARELNFAPPVVSIWRPRSGQNDLTPLEARFVDRIEDLHQFHGLDRAVNRRFYPVDRPEKVLHLRDELIRYRLKR